MSQSDVLRWVWSRTVQGRKSGVYVSTGKELCWFKQVANKSDAEMECIEVGVE